MKLERRGDSSKIRTCGHVGESICIACIVAKNFVDSSFFGYASASRNLLLSIECNEVRCGEARG